MMRWIVLVVAVVACSAGAVVLVQYLPTEQSLNGEVGFPTTGPGRDGPPGKLVIDPEDTTYKFGMMAQEEKGEHVWIFKNEGEGELELTKGESTCSCTIANFDIDKPSFVLEPKKDTKIRLAWNTRKNDGAFEKSAQIHVIGDPNRKLVTLAVSGRVQPAMKVMPDNRIIDFRSIPNDVVQKGKAAFASADKPDFKIISIRTTRPDQVVATFRPMPDEDREPFDKLTGGYRIDVEMKPTPDVGVFREDIIIETDHPLVPEIKLEVSGKRSGPVSVFPEELRFLGVSSEKGAQAAAMIVVRDAPENIKFEITDTPENVQATIVPVEAKAGSTARIRQFRITVTVLPNAPPETIIGIITVKSNHPNASRLKIPVQASVLGGAGLIR